MRDDHHLSVLLLIVCSESHTHKKARFIAGFIYDSGFVRYNCLQTV